MIFTHFVRGYHYILTYDRRRSQRSICDEPTESDSPIADMIVPLPYPADPEMRALSTMGGQNNDPVVTAEEESKQMEPIIYFCSDSKFATELTDALWFYRAAGTYDHNRTFKYHHSSRI